VFRFALSAAALTVAGSGRGVAAQGTPVGPAAGNVATGLTFYAKLGCETCHGLGGRGTAAGPAIAGTPRQLPAFIAYVRQPTGTMPPQSAQAVSDQALADIHAYLRAASVKLDQAPAAPAGRADNGGILFRKIGCYQCHANEAQGGLSGPRIGPDPIPFARFAQYVRSPTGDMPPYTERVLSNQDLADIYAFLQARPRPPAVNTIPQLAP
jgi:mono/diheme cytochrome c family protein